MTPKQRHALLLKWWPAACAAQGWAPRDRPLRLRVLNLALNRTFGNAHEIRTALEPPEANGVGTARPHPLRPPGDPAGRDGALRRPCEPGTASSPLVSAQSLPRREIQSACELNNGPDIDAVKSLLKMLTDDLRATAEQGQPEPGQDRRLASQIRDQIKCLAMYPLERPMKKAGAEAYLLKIARQKIPILRPLTSAAALHHLTTPPEFPTPISPIPPIPPIPPISPITAIIPPTIRQQILYTLSARINGKTGYRRAAGHTLHTMRTRAGVPCPCAQCRR